MELTETKRLQETQTQEKTACAPQPAARSAGARAGRDQHWGHANPQTQHRDTLPNTLPIRNASPERAAGAHSPA